MQQGGSSLLYSATSKALPYGHYVLWETQAPPSYQLSTTPTYVDITDDGKIMDVAVTDVPMDYGLTISKTGSYEVQAGDSFYYSITSVANTSNVPLTNFNWIDTFPTEAVRLQKAETGSYSAQVNLTVSFKTNYSDEWRDWGSGIDTSQSAELDFGNVLGADEYVTELRFDFGTVPAGFHSVEETRLYVTALCDLDNGQSFTNNVRLSGQAQDGTLLFANAAWSSTIWRQLNWRGVGRLPQTGQN